MSTSNKLGVIWQQKPKSIAVAASALAVALTAAEVSAGEVIKIGAPLVVLEDVFTRTGSLDGQAIRDALAATDIMPFYGSIDFGENGLNQARELPIIQVQDHKIEVLFPDSIKTSDIRLIK